MATAASAVRRGLIAVTAALSADLNAVAAGEAAGDRIPAILEALPVIVPAYYDAAGSLAVAWYDERRSEASPGKAFTPRIVGGATTEWIDREAARILSLVETTAGTTAAQLTQATRNVIDLAEREAARGFRDTITQNTWSDDEAIGWSRFTRPGACSFCRMLAARGAVYKATTARFSAHGAVGRGRRRGGNCQCIAAPEFADGTHGPEASPLQYVASRKNRTPAQRAQVREYLNENFPDAPG